ncbi:MAG: hypothetical protein A2X40_00460 [Elusimicrobia bacterium GWC2_65_9]|nr:MAG: hypothetical protein A2X40_00460 [Elusimicrobia bacterium GWC2_65_9]
MSRFDQLIEQISFGTASAPAGPCLGLYLSPEVIYLSETHREKGGRLAVDHLVRIPIPAEGKNPGATATMNTDFLSDPLKIAGFLRQSMSQMRWNSKSVRVTLSHHLGLVRYFSMPAMEHRYLHTAVPLEAKKHIPIPFDLLAHDFQAIPLPPDAQGKARLGVLIMVTQRKNIANVQGLLKALGLKLKTLEVAPCSVLRLWQEIDPAKDGLPYLHVHIDGANVRVLVCDRGTPVFFREVFLGGAAALSDQRKIDLSGCLSFVRKQLNLDGLSHVRVSGDTAALEELRAAFAAETGVAAVIQDTPKLLSVKSGDWGGYASLGASMSAPPSATAALDLCAQDRVTEEERETARDILIAGAAFALLFTGQGLYESAAYAYRARELRQYKIDPDVAARLSGMSSDAIEAQIKDMQSQTDQLRRITGSGGPKVTQLLKEIIEAMPANVWLDRIDLSNPLSSESRPYEITLTGRAQDRTVPDEQALAFKFKENLLKAPMLSKTFDVQISVQKSGSDDAGQSGLDPQALAASLEERTKFSLSIRSKP